MSNKILTLNTKNDCIEAFLPNWREIILDECYLVGTHLKTKDYLLANTFHINPLVLNHITGEECMEATEQLLTIFPLSKNDFFHEVMSKTQFISNRSCLTTLIEKDGELISTRVDNSLLIINEPNPTNLSDYTLFQYKDYIYSFWMDLQGSGPCINTIYRASNLKLAKKWNKTIKVKVKHNKATQKVA